MEQVNTETTHSPAVQYVDTTAIFFNPALMDRLERFAQIMASGKATIPEHFHNNVGDCMAVIIQSMQWKMNPHAVAQKTFSVYGNLGYEAQLVNAVITSIAPTKGRLQYEWFGEWDQVLGKIRIKTNEKGNTYCVGSWNSEDEFGLGIKVYGTLIGEDEPRVLELKLTQAHPRNSTLWATDPKQQLAYLAIKKWARLHTPDVILGVYTPDELENKSTEKDITPVASPSAKPAQSKSEGLLNKLQQAESNVIEIEPEQPAANDDIVQLQVVLDQINWAENEEQLKKVVILATELPKADQAKARKAYKNKLADLEAALDE